MSLINDALRRARQAQQTPRAPTTNEGPAFRAPLPAPPTSTRDQRIPLLPALCLAAIGVTALIIAWNWKVHHSRVPLEAQARSVPASLVPEPATGPARLPGAVEPEPLQAGRGEKPQVSSSSPSAKESTPGTLPNQADTTGSPAQASTAAVATPASAPPKLQSIIYHPKRPSAMIDGKVLFVGDKLRDLRVIAITPTGATLASPSGTNHLEL